MSCRNSLLVALLITCAGVTVGSAQDKIRVGVWNIEKLSTNAKRGFPELRGNRSLDPRSDSDLDQIAVYIKDVLEVDALMVTEIEADAPASTTAVPQSAQLNYIAQQMGSNWKYFLGRTGGRLRLGLLFNSDRIRLKKLVNLHASEFRVTGRDVLARDPFIAWVSVVDNAGQTRNDVLLVCVHLKSIQDRFRNNRMAAIAKLVGDITDAETRAILRLPSKNEEREILILGDCNDSEFRRARFKYMFDYLAGTGFKHLRPNDDSYPDTRVNGSKIDHVFATSKVINSTMVPGSFRVHTVPKSKREDYRETFSDHFPVTVDLRVQTDEDLTFEEALLVADDARRGALLAEMTEELSRAVRVDPTTMDDEEEDAAPPVVKFDVIEEDFDRILAPQPRGLIDEQGIPDPGVPAPRGIPDAAAPAAARGPASRDTAIWTAIDLIQEDMSSILSEGDSLSADDLQRVRRLMCAQRGLLEVVRDRR